MKSRNNAGFSLVEMLVAIVILGLITIPMTSGMVASMKILASSEKMMDAQLAVSSAVEVLMAKGIDPNNIPEFGDNVDVDVEVVGGEPYYEVTVTCGKVEITTYIREKLPEQGGGVQ